MTKVINKSAKTSIADVAAVPNFRTRDAARAFAGRMRSAGVAPSSPVKGSDGWQVKAKFEGGTLSRRG